MSCPTAACAGGRIWWRRDGRMPPAEPIEYANLAIRGRLVWPIVEEQLEPALALKPTHLSFNGGGNDMLRPRHERRARRRRVLARAQAMR